MIFFSPEKSEPRNGILRLFQVIIENASDLVVANLLGCLLMAPSAVSFLGVFCIVRNFWLAFVVGMLFGAPIGGALCGIEKVSLNIIRAREKKAAATFWETFRYEWRRSIPLGYMAYLEIILMVCAILFHKEINAFELPIRLWALLFLIILFTHLILTFSYSQQILMELSLRKLLKNSLLLFLANFGKSILCLFITLAVLCVLLIFIPFSLLFVVILGFSIVSLIRQIFVWPIINRLFSIDQKQDAIKDVP